MNHANHGRGPGGKGADSVARPPTTGQAQLEQIQLQVPGGQSCQAVRTEKRKGWQWTSGTPKQAGSAVGGGKGGQKRLTQMNGCAAFCGQPSGRKTECHDREFRNRPHSPTTRRVLSDPCFFVFSLALSPFLK